MVASGEISSAKINDGEAGLHRELAKLLK